ncbi:MAG: helix-turn-helix domain-containing protein [Acidobacteria bacterium]|nr:helix-turn-helix domain-containing protein [Acidobacteriota bacterium]
MIGKPIVLIQVPNQRLFGTKAAARYLGIHEHTLRKYADLGRIKARRLLDDSRRARRVFPLEELDKFIESLPQWYDSADGVENSGVERSKTHGDL